MSLSAPSPDDLPREKLYKRGLDALTDTELLALLLNTGYKDHNVLTVAARLLGDSGGLASLSRWSLQELESLPGIGQTKAAKLAAIFELGRRALREELELRKIDTPDAVYSLLAHEFAAKRQESLCVLLLNMRHHLIRIDTITTGSVNESIADPRDIFRNAIVHGAAALILAHNHPSGDPSPSEADRQLTRRIHDAATLLRFRLLDHVIIGQPAPGRPGFFSFKENGLL